MKNNSTTVPYNEFLKILKKYSYIKVSVKVGKGASEFVYLKVSKKEITEIIRMVKIKCVF